ncbi:hypothetical protein KQX54_021197 [Cotesia glomerata]|uniref:Uncharacterized protein n=1 Tax=Cotesia glomerata TaxID=32391 RepID=A0AAV7J6W6_COTGL|nr:hypothetical protein KQX54_021197 [Cotesia glomerata]
MTAKYTAKVRRRHRLRKANPEYQDALAPTHLLHLLSFSPMDKDVIVRNDFRQPERARHRYRYPIPLHHLIDSFLIPLLYSVTTSLIFIPILQPPNHLLFFPPLCAGIKRAYVVCKLNSRLNINPLLDIQQMILGRDRDFSGWSADPRPQYIYRDRMRYRNYDTGE